MSHTILFSTKLTRLFITYAMKSHLEEEEEEEEVAN